MPGDIEITSTSGLLRHITIFYMQGLSIGPRTFSSALTNLQPALAQGPLKLYLGLSTRGEKGVGYQAIPPPQLKIQLQRKIRSVGDAWLCLDLQAKLWAVHHLSNCFRPHYDPKHRSFH